MSIIKICSDLSHRAKPLFLFTKMNNIPHEWTWICPSKSIDQNQESQDAQNFLNYPVITDGDLKLCENSSSLRYLSRKYPIADHWYPRSIKNQARVDEFLEWQMKLRLPLNELLTKQILQNTNAPFGCYELRERLDECLTKFELSWLNDGRPFVTGDDITIGDILAMNEVEESRMWHVEPILGRPKLRSWLDRVITKLEPYNSEVDTFLKEKMALKRQKRKINDILTQYDEDINRLRQSGIGKEASGLSDIQLRRILALLEEFNLKYKGKPKSRKQSIPKINKEISDRDILQTLTPFKSVIIPDSVVNSPYGGKAMVDIADLKGKRLKRKGKKSKLATNLENELDAKKKQDFDQKRSDDKISSYYEGKYHVMLSELPGEQPNAEKVTATYGGEIRPDSLQEKAVKINFENGTVVVKNEGKVEKDELQRKGEALPKRMEGEKSNDSKDVIKKEKSFEENLKLLKPTIPAINSKATKGSEKENFFSSHMTTETQQKVDELIKKLKQDAMVASKTLKTDRPNINSGVGTSVETMFKATHCAEIGRPKANDISQIKTVFPKCKNDIENCEKCVKDMPTVDSLTRNSTEVPNKNQNDNSFPDTSKGSFIKAKELKESTISKPFNEENNKIESKINHVNAYSGESGDKKTLNEKETLGKKLANAKSVEMIDTIIAYCQSGSRNSTAPDSKNKLQDPTSGATASMTPDIEKTKKMDAGLGAMQGPNMETGVKKDSPIYDPKTLEKSTTNSYTVDSALSKNNGPTNISEITPIKKGDTVSNPSIDLDEFFTLNKNWFDQWMALDRSDQNLHENKAKTDLILNDAVEAFRSSEVSNPGLSDKDLKDPIDKKPTGTTVDDADKRSK